MLSDIWSKGNAPSMNELNVLILDQEVKVVQNNKEWTEKRSFNIIT